MGKITISSFNCIITNSSRCCKRITVILCYSLRLIFPFTFSLPTSTFTFYISTTSFKTSYFQKFPFPFHIKKFVSLKNKSNCIMFIIIIWFAIYNVYFILKTAMMILGTSCRHHRSISLVVTDATKMYKMTSTQKNKTERGALDMLSILSIILRILSVQKWSHTKFVLDFPIVIAQKKLNISEYLILLYFLSFTSLLF